MLLGLAVEPVHQVTHGHAVDVGQACLAYGGDVFVNHDVEQGFLLTLRYTLELGFDFGDDGERRTAPGVA